MNHNERSPIGAQNGSRLSSGSAAVSSTSLQPRGTPIHFAWLARRHPARAPWPPLLATALTIAAIMAISQPLVPLYRTQHGATRAVETKPRLLLTFLVPAQPPPPVRPRQTRPPQRQVPAEAVPTPVPPSFPSSRFSQPAVPQPQTVVTPPATTAPADTGSATPSPSPDLTSPASRALGPRRLPAGISTAHPRTAAGRDSVLEHLSSDARKLAKTLPLTQAEKDSALREQSRLDRVARDEHRPPMLQAGGSVSLPIPFLSYSKSPEQQVRDSTLNADIQARLARLTRRGLAKRDSIRRADSLAKDSVKDSIAARDARSDSTPPPHTSKPRVFNPHYRSS